MSDFKYYSFFCDGYEGGEESGEALPGCGLRHRGRRWQALARARSSSKPAGRGIEVPMGAHGIFPKFKEEIGDTAAPDVREAFFSGFKNYSSFYEVYEGAKWRWSATWLRVTASRSSGARRLERTPASRSFGARCWGKDPHGSIPERALIVKAKAGRHSQRRIIVDPRRSGADSKSVCPNASSYRDPGGVSGGASGEARIAGVATGDRGEGRFGHVELRGGVRRLLGRLQALGSGPTRASVAYTHWRGTHAYATGFGALRGIMLFQEQFLCFD